MAFAVTTVGTGAKGPPPPHLHGVPARAQVLWQAERPERVLDTIRVLEACGLAAACPRVPCREAGEEELGRVHTEPHVRAMLGLVGAEGPVAAAAAAGFNTVFMNGASVGCALLAAGGWGGACRVRRARVLHHWHTHTHAHTHTRTHAHTHTRTHTHTHTFSMPCRG
jgi:hypothetical protein